MKRAGGHEIGKELQRLFWQQLLSLHYRIFAIYFPKTVAQAMS